MTPAMKTRPPMPPRAGALGILCVEPDARDREAFRDLYHRVAWPGDCRRRLTMRPCVQSAIPVLRSHEVGVVLCESQTATGSWRELLELTELLVEPPLLIVTSRIADECLWAEALNLGAWVVLAKPYDPGEVERVVALACSHWLDRPQRSQTATE